MIPPDTFTSKSQSHKFRKIFAMIRTLELIYIWSYIYMYLYMYTHFIYPKISKLKCSFVVPLLHFVVNKEHTILRMFYVPSDEQSTFQLWSHLVHLTFPKENILERLGISERIRSLPRITKIEFKLSEC